MARARHLPALDGVRAIAVAAVLAFHLGHLRGGFLGVDLFFVVSGFLITRQLLDEHARTGRVRLVEFWRRRARRLAPAMIVVVVATVLATRTLADPWRSSVVRVDAWASLTYVANWRFVANGESYFASGLGPSPLRHMWSLAVEEQFYVLWPLLVLGAAAAWSRIAHGRSARPVGIAPAAAVVAPAVAVLSAGWMAVASIRADDLSRVYYGTDTRIFALAVGGWAAVRWGLGAEDRPTGADRTLERWAGAVGLAIMAVLVVVVSDSDPTSYRGPLQAAALASAAVVIGLARGGGGLARWLAAAPLRWLGRRSYGIYLWSWPIQVLATERFGWDGWLLASVVVGSSVALAAISFALIEEPVRTGRAPWGRTAPTTEPRVDRRMPGLAALGVATVVGLVAVTAPTSGAPPAPEYLSISDDQALDAALAPARPRPTSPAGGEDDEPARVVVTGDSVGWTIGTYGEGVDDRIEVSTRAIFTCGLMTTEAAWIGATGGPVTYFDRCDNQAAADALAVAEEPDLIVLWLGAWEVYDHEYRGRTHRVGTETYGDVFRGLLQRRVDVYREGGIPTLLPLVSCFGRPAGPGHPNMDPPRHEGWRIAWVNEQIRAVAAANPDWVHLADPSEVLCEADGTAVEHLPGGAPVRADGVHFDQRSAPWLWETWLAEAVMSVLEG